jgi:hypothetical protein
MRRSATLSGVEPLMPEVIEFYTTKGPCGFLTNFSPHPIVWGGRTYPTQEHLYQARKAESDGDHEAIRTAPRPRLAMENGRLMVRRRDWEWPDVWPDGAIELVKDRVMFEGLYLKVAQNPELREPLLATGDALLVEQSPEDDYWGIAFEKGGTGKNKLGQLWMQVRELVRQGQDMPLPRTVYDRLVHIWARDTGYLSDMRTDHFAHREIVGIGKRAIPWLLEDARRVSMNEKFPTLFTNASIALSEIVPQPKGFIPPEDAGRVAKIAARWVAWGKENGYVFDRNGYIQGA